MSAKKTQKQFLEEVIALHPNLLFNKSVYVKASEKLTVTCPVHGDFEQTPNKLLAGKGCPKCSLINRANKKRNSIDTLEQRCREVHGYEYEYDFSTYTKMKEPMVMFCKKHGRFEQSLNNHIYNKAKCPKCANEQISLSQRHSLEDVIKEAIKVHNGFYSYDNVINYVDKSSTVLITCPIHGDFPQTFADHLSKRGCPKCGIQKMADKRRNSSDEMLERSKLAHQGKYSYENFNYVNYTTPCKITCKIHGEFEQAMINHLKGCGCPKCVGAVSKKETEIVDFLSQYVNVSTNRRDILDSGKELDIFIEDLNLAIEYNGLYFHSDKFKPRAYHRDKTKSATEKGIKLIQIFEDEWDNKQDIVKSRLLNLIGKNTNKIHARNCNVELVSAKEAKDFLELNHIQGNVNSKIRIALKYNGEIVSLMTFGALRKSLGSKGKEGDFELVRFVNKLNTTVNGAASKLLKHFEKTFEWNSIISFADLRWSDGGLYNTLGFTEMYRTQPNYFYTKGNQRENRFKYKKDTLIKEGFDSNKSESEIMKERGFLKIFDCGAIKFVKTKK